MAIGLVEFELALGEFLSDVVGEVPVGAAFLRRAEEPLGVMFRESGSTNDHDLDGPIELNTQTYDIECIQRGESQSPGEPGVELKSLTQSVIDSLNGLTAGTVIGTTLPGVTIDSMLVMAQTVRVTDDSSKGGPQLVYSLTVATNYLSTEPG